ncbi:uncharacterized protein LOC111264123 [Varroa jacobsoni]|nr:uncharacterized protein LOC111264123 [Varroa jacobsoni]
MRGAALGGPPTSGPLGPSLAALAPSQAHDFTIRSLSTSGSEERSSRSPASSDSSAGIVVGSLGHQLGSSAARNSKNFSIDAILQVQQQQEKQQQKQPLPQSARRQQPGTAAAAAAAAAAVGDAKSGSTTQGSSFSDPTRFNLDLHSRLAVHWLGLWNSHFLRQSSSTALATAAASIAPQMTLPSGSPPPLAIRPASPADSDDNEVTIAVDEADDLELQDSPEEATRTREWQEAQPDSTQKEDEEVDVCEIDN